MSLQCLHYRDMPVSPEAQLRLSTVESAHCMYAPILLFNAPKNCYTPEAIQEPTHSHIKLTNAMSKQNAE